jgi:hypothetical protein
MLVDYRLMLLWRQADEPYKVVRLGRQDRVRVGRLYFARKKSTQAWPAAGVPDWRPNPSARRIERNAQSNRPHAAGPGQAAAEGDEQHPVAGGGAAGTHRFVQGNRD